jgi:hypothetical protein
LINLILKILDVIFYGIIFASSNLYYVRQIDNLNINIRLINLTGGSILIKNTKPGCIFLDFKCMHYDTEDEVLSAPHHLKKAIDINSTMGYVVLSCLTIKDQSLFLKLYF